jgi:hypothetical protein
MPDASAPSALRQDTRSMQLLLRRAEKWRAGEMLE